MAEAILFEPRHETQIMEIQSIIEEFCPNVDENFYGGLGNRKHTTFFLGLI